MRAAVLREGELTVRETADPEPGGSGHLLLRTVACAVCASDVHFMDHGADESGNGLFGGYDARADVVMGHEFVGEVVGHGADVNAEKFPLGSRVTSIPFLVTADGGHIVGQHTDAPGGFGERMLVSQDLARVVPETVAADTVALVDALVIAGRLDPSPAIGAVIGLDGVAEALDAVRNAQGPPRIVVKPNGTGAR